MWRLALVLAACGSDPRAPELPTPSDPRWQGFVDARTDRLNALAAPVRACVAMHDTDHPAFHGCIDWHSAVHGTWALLTVARLTGDPADQAAADAVLQPQPLADEMAMLAQTGMDGETPYGFAWFLALARERGRTHADLAPLAQSVAAMLDAWLAEQSDADLQAAALTPEYGNLSWVLLNLWQYAVDVGDDALAARTLAVAHRVLLPLDCTLADETTTFADDFFPPCLHRALALVTMLPADEANTFATAFAPDPLPPVTEPTTSHSAGLDFSRSWGLYAMWRATGDEAWIGLYLDHFEAWIAQPQYWAEDYPDYAHWVAQFGIYSLALTAEDYPP